MKYVIVFEFEPGNCQPEVFGPYDDIHEAFNDISTHFPEAEICPPTHANMKDDFGIPEALMSVLPVSTLLHSVKELRERMYDEDSQADA